MAEDVSKQSIYIVKIHTICSVFLGIEVVDAFLDNREERISWLTVDLHTCISVTNYQVGSKELDKDEDEREDLHHHRL